MSRALTSRAYRYVRAQASVVVNRRVIQGSECFSTWWICGPAPATTDGGFRRSPRTLLTSTPTVTGGTDSPARTRGSCRCSTRPGQRSPGSGRVRRSRRHQPGVLQRANLGDERLEIQFIEVATGAGPRARRGQAGGAEPYGTAPKPQTLRLQRGRRPLLGFAGLGVVRAPSRRLSDVVRPVGRRSKNCAVGPTRGNLTVPSRDTAPASTYVCLYDV